MVPHHVRSPFEHKAETDTRFIPATVYDNPFTNPEYIKVLSSSPAGKETRGSMATGTSPPASSSPPSAGHPRPQDFALTPAWNGSPPWITASRITPSSFSPVESCRRHHRVRRTRYPRSHSPGHRPILPRNAHASSVLHSASKLHSGAARCL